MKKTLSLLLALSLMLGLVSLASAQDLGPATKLVVSPHRRIHRHPRPGHEGLQGEGGGAVRRQHHR